MRLLPNCRFALHAKILGNKIPRDWPDKDVSEVLDKFADPAIEYVYTPRSEMSLSQHPRLKRLHPDFDPVSGQDHNPSYMAREVKRWSIDYLQDDLETIQSKLTGVLPSHP